MKRYANQPTLAQPWDRATMTLNATTPRFLKARRCCDRPEKMNLENCVAARPRYGVLAAAGVEAAGAAAAGVEAAGGVEGAGSAAAVVTGFSLS